jgi:hypothetical protein
MAAMAQQATACKQLLLMLCLGCLVVVAPVAGDASLGRRLLIRCVPPSTAGMQHELAVDSSTNFLLAAPPASTDWQAIASRHYILQKHHAGPVSDS